MTVRRFPSEFSTSFSDTVVVSGPGKWIQVSGQVGADESGKISAASFSEETETCLQRIAKSLEMAGASLDHVVRITAFMTDLGDYADYSKVRQQFFPTEPPASATVQVSGLLLDARIEIDALAFVPET